MTKYSKAQLIKWQSSILAKVMKGEAVKKCGRPVGVKEVGKRLQPERDLRIEVIKSFKKQGFRVWRIENSLPGYRGLPDLIIAKHGFFAFIELKAPDGVIKYEQQLFADLCHSDGVKHWFVHSLEHIKNIT